MIRAAAQLQQHRAPLPRLVRPHEPGERCREHPASLAGADVLHRAGDGRVGGVAVVALSDAAAEGELHCGRDGDDGHQRIAPTVRRCS